MRHPILVGIFLVSVVGLAGCSTEEGATPAFANPHCTFGQDQTCNDNPEVSTLWGRCQSDGRCLCLEGFEINTETGRCRPGEGEREQGTEGGPCYGNDTCNPGLKCLSGLCVKVPVADAYIPPINNTRPGETGCECTTASGPASAWPLLLLALGLMISRRRRSGHA